MMNLGVSSDGSAVAIKEEVTYIMLVRQPNNCQLPIQEGANDQGKKALGVADGVKQEVLRKHFQNNL